MQRKNKTDIRDIIKKYCDIQDREEVNAAEFCKMLEKLGIILSSSRDDVKYFMDEYAHQKPFDASDLDEDKSKSKSIEMDSARNTGNRKEKERQKRQQKQA